MQTPFESFNLSDITSGDGREIIKETWECQLIDSSNRHMDAQWPNWDRIASSNRSLWRRALTIAFYEREEGLLITPLGRWISRDFGKWQWFLAGDKMTLYQKNERDGWTVFHQQGKQLRYNKFDKQGEAKAEIDERTLIPTTIIHGKNHWRTTGGCECLGKKQQAVGTDGAYRNWLYHKVTSSRSIERLIESIEKGKVITVSDGSFIPQEGIGTAAWIITTEDRKEYIRGVSISPGKKELQSAYRSEILGQLAIHDKLQEMVEEFNITKGGGIIACDGLGALRKSNNKHKDGVNPKHLHCDLLTPTQALLDKSPLCMTPTNVKGHQDDQQMYEELNILAQINVDMDHAAKVLDTEIKNSGLRFDNGAVHPKGFMTVSFENTIVHQDIYSGLYGALADRAIKNHWIEKGRFTEATIEKIDWEANYRAMKLSSIGRRHFVTKWSNEWVAAGKNV